MDKVLAGVLRKITPSKAEAKKVEQALQKILGGVNKVLEPMGLEFTVAGSYMRNTYMKDKKEFDIFIMFPENTSREELEKRGLEVGKKIVKALKGSYIVAYAEHPYIRSTVGGYSVDLVPCYKLKSAEKIKSAVDRTPFHNEWLREHFKPEMAAEARLLKQLCKGQGIYGSDTRVLGLSGYLCELLIACHKSFRKFVKEAARWEAGRVFIDLEGHCSADRKKFKGEPLVVIDPVDSKRNVASALSPANFAKLVDACGRLLEKPSPGLFFRKHTKASLRELERAMVKRKTRFIGLLFDQPQVIQDVLWPQLRRGAKRLKAILEEYEFHVMGTDVWSDPEFTKGRSLILLEMEVWMLPEVRKVTGPPVFIKERSDEFLKKYRKMGRIMVEEDRWVAETHRVWKSANEKLKDSLSDPEKVLLEKGVPSYIAKAVSKKFRLLDNKGILEMAKKSKDVKDFLVQYLEREVL